MVVPDIIARGGKSRLCKHGGDREIYVMNAGGGNVRQLTFNSVFDIHPDWSPEGGKIAFYSSRFKAA